MSDAAPNIHRHRDMFLIYRSVDGMRATERDRCVDLVRGVLDDPKVKARTKLMAIKVLAAIDAMALRDHHHTEKMQHENGMLDLRIKRAEAGLPNDSMVLQVAPVRELPLPEGLREMRKRLIEGKS